MEQAARYRQAINLACEGKARAALREAKAQAASKLSAKARAAGRKLKDRRASGAEPPVRTPEQVAAAEQRFNAQKQGALEEARHTQLHRRQPALVGARSHPAEVARPSEAPSSKSTAAIGKPGVMQMVDGNGDFVGRLRKQPSTLPGVREKSISYTKRPPADAKALRDKFDGKVEHDPTTKGLNPRPFVENRSNFLKGLAKDPDKVKALKKAGLTDANINLMKVGGCPKGWEVHHKLPLDDGGTNAPDNLVLIKDDPYHYTVTSAQATLTKGMKPGDTKTLNWPIPPGFVYPP